MIARSRFFLSLLPALAFGFLARPAFATIVYGGDATYVNAGDVNTTSTALTLGQSGNGSVLFVIIGAENQPSGLAVSYGGTYMNLTGSASGGNGNTSYFNVYYLSNPVSGNALSISGTALSPFSFMWFTYGGVSPVSPIGTVAINANTLIDSASGTTVTASFRFTPSNPLSTVIEYMACAQSNVSLAKVLSMGYGVGNGTVRVPLVAAQNNAPVVGGAFGDYAPGSTAPFNLTESVDPDFNDFGGMLWGIELLEDTTPTITPTYSVSPSPVETATYTESNTAVVTSTYSVSPSPVETATDTESSTALVTPVETATDTESNTAVVTPVETATDTESNTVVVTPVETATVTESITVVATLSSTDLPTPIETGSNTESVTPVETATYTESVTFTGTRTFTSMSTPTRTVTLTESPTLSRTPSSTASPTMTGSPTRTGTNTFTDSPTASVSRTRTETPSATATFTVSFAATNSPTPGPVAVTVFVYSSSGVLLRTLPAGTSEFPVWSAGWSDGDSPGPYNPEEMPLVLRGQGWSFSYDGKDSNGQYLTNGVYTLVIESVQRSQVTKTVLQFTVVGSVGVQLGLLVWPNPVRSGESVTIQWSPLSQRAYVSVYRLNGGLVRSFGIVYPPLVWNLTTASGEQVADGIYFIGVRSPGRRAPQWFKLGVAR